MYLDFYHLREHPFGETPDPRFLHFTPSHREALASIFYAIEIGRGFSALIAAPGMGKTTLLNHLRQAIKENSRTVFFFQIDRTSRHLYESLMKELGIPPTHDDAQRVITEALNRNARRGERLVLIIDEAQNLEPSILESVRLLSNIETPTVKLLHIVLAGQPQLADTLSRQELAQLRQRISTLCRLSPLTEKETDQYIAHRLWVAGHKGDAIFSPGAVEMIAASSRGIPRNINSLAANALSLGFVKRQAFIDTSTVGEVIDDLNLRNFSTEWDPTVRDVGGVREVIEVESSPSVPVDKPPAPPSAVRNNYSPDPLVEALRSAAAKIAAPAPAPQELSAAVGETPLRLEKLRKLSHKLGRREIVFSIIVLACWLAVMGGVSYVGKPDPTNIPGSMDPSAASKAEVSTSGQEDSPETITVEVQQDQTLEQIGRRYFGHFDTSVAQQIYRLNPDLADPRRLQIGQRIRLPKDIGSRKRARSTSAALADVSVPSDAPQEGQKP